MRESETREKSQLVEENEKETDEILVPASTLIANTKQDKSQTPQKKRNTFEQKPCIYCGGKHRADKCQKINLTKDRRSFLVKNNRCLNCLRQGHLKWQCRSRGRCFNCGPKHHTSICEQSNKPEKESKEKHEEKQESTNPP